MDHDDPYRVDDDLSRASGTPDDADSAHHAHDRRLASAGFDGFLEDVWPWRPPLHDAALSLVNNTPRARILREQLESLHQLDGLARQRATARIREEIAGIVAQAITAQNQRREFLYALATFRNDQTPVVSEPAAQREQHPLVGQITDVAQNVLAKLGHEMLIETVFPGVHVILPPTDFVDSVFAAVTMLKAAEHPARIHHPVNTETPPAAEDPAEAKSPAQQEKPAQPAKIEDQTKIGKRAPTETLAERRQGAKVEEQPSRDKPVERPVRFEDRRPVNHPARGHPWRL